MIGIKAYGELSEWVLQHEVDAAGLNKLEDLHEQLLQRFPQLKNRSYRYAINGQFADDSTPLSDNDEVLLMPPFSGG